MAAHPATPVHANVAWLRIPRFESLTVAAQAASKDAMEVLSREAVAGRPSADRIVLDATDGMAIVLFGAPDAGLDFAQALRGRAGEGAQVGLNYGPLALTSRGAESRVCGDGLEAAHAAARFAQPGQVIATEDFARALRASDPDRAVEMAGAGEFTDSHVRLHAFYTPDPERRAQRHRRVALYGIGGTIAILLVGVIARDLSEPLFARPAVITLDVKPRGEVFVDGQSRGRTPPLKTLEVEPGRRRLEIRNPGSVPYDVTLELKSRQRVTVSHTFRPAEQKGGGFWRELKRKLGG